MTQGGRAIETGGTLEEVVVSLLGKKQYREIGADLRKTEKMDALAASFFPRRYARQPVICKGVYGTDIQTDFFLLDQDKFPEGLIIECKWQQSTGSVDEKLPYLDLNIRQRFPALTVVLIDGDGWKKGAIEWLKAQVGVNQNLIGVYSIKEFMTWANNRL